ncbi:hypothetical protein TOPH_07209 [Tolypocladium ophioglossoides CBS 100239]|uniref:Protein kinase domain-containing protein n=1 Tax=Tolypocladium ophioglossoides (strain CBS 100239) TaxID=1163406 RepID=A0A0L0N292_TOLOC|nr:hypothetical protein TOPH_07209 [Tolypocladium ophioglossoides CBS 100239]
MSSQSSLPMPEFELVEEIERGVWTAIKVGDPCAGQFLARRIDIFDGAYDAAATKRSLETGEQGALWLTDLLYNFGQVAGIAQIFNHENIVSLAGRIQQQPLVGGAGGEQETMGMDGFLVWDFCDAANLSALFLDQPCKSTAYYLPESLCWHVLRALTRAVTYLHDGKRLTIDADDDGSNEPRWMTMNRDWNPILHRAIEPDNVFFQHPRGAEVYGLCKLGNFGTAAVTGHVLGPGDGYGQEDWPCSVAVSTQRGWEALEETRPKVARDPEKWTADKRPYTLSDELWSVGNVLFNMMTGRRLTFVCRPYGCAHVTKCSEGGCLGKAAAENMCDCLLGGCRHVPETACTHEVSDWDRSRDPRCEQPVINIDSYMAKARYSHWLRGTVKSLLEFDPKSKLLTTKALPFAKTVEEQIQLWREDTDEGQDYVDIDDGVRE